MHLKPISNETELYQFEEYMITVYGAEQESYTTNLQWWRSYPTGCLLLKDEDAIVGSFNLLPLSAEQYQLLVSGKIKERDLEALPLKKDEQCQYWHVLNIHLLEKYRDGDTFRFLLDELEKIVEKSGNFPEQISVTGLILSPDGQKFFQRLGCQQLLTAEQTQDGLPLFAGALQKPYFYRIQ